MNQEDRYYDPNDPWECTHDELHEDHDECSDYEQALYEDAMLELAEVQQDLDRFGP